MSLPNYPERGWLAPYLVALDCTEARREHYKEKLTKKQLARIGPLPFRGPGRWAYWAWICEHEDLPAAPIPQLHFISEPYREDQRHIQELLRQAVRYHWRWYDEAWLYLVKWILHGFGLDGLEREVQRIPDEVSRMWYENFNLAHLLHSPCDWSAFVLQGGLHDDKSTRSPWAKSTGFYSTPMDVIRFMSRITYADDKPTSVDRRLLSVYDCCCGTGSILLDASNYSLRLYGQELVYDLVLCAKLNGYLFAPWLVHMPDGVSAMLDHKYQQGVAIDKMLSLMRGEAWEATGANQDAAALPAGVEVSHNELTAQKAQERKESAEDFYTAMRNGTLKQASMF